MNKFDQILSACLSRCDDASFSTLVEYAQARPLSLSEVGSLTTTMAKSGSQLSFTTHTRTADIASTGGPTSLSTLLCPLYLRCMGSVVSSLGVPGRPAGAVDVLAQIPNYSVHLPLESVSTILSESGYVHVTADNAFAPLDARLFEYRRRMKVKAIPALAVASLLSKKLAMGVLDVGLDIRIGPHGNFGSSYTEASDNARLFCLTAQHLGMHAVCFLTDGTTPYQPYVGRSESLLALREIMTGSASGWLAEHSNMCRTMANALIKSQIDLDLSSVRDVFSRNLEAQGAAYISFAEVCQCTEKAHRVPVCATSDGFLSVDMDLLRSTLGEWQATSETNRCEYPDSCGLIFTKKHNEYIRQGETVALVRCHPSHAQKVAQAFDPIMKSVPVPLRRMSLDSVCIE